MVQFTGIRAHPFYLAVYLRNLSRMMGRLGVMVDIENVFRQEIYSPLFRLSRN